MTISKLFAKIGAGIAMNASKRSANKASGSGYHQPKEPQAIAQLKRNNNR